MLQLGDTVNRLLPDEQVYNFRSKPEMEMESSEEPDRASKGQRSDLSTCTAKELPPVADRDMGIQVKANSSSDENLVYEDTRNDIPTHRHYARKAEADAKAVATRHLLSDPDDATEQADKAANAKVGKTQHSSTKCPSQRVKKKQRQGDNRPKARRALEPDKTCIWIEYRQHRLSSLLDTGSDVSIAGERVAHELGWTIRAHDTEEVGVVNKKTMTILGAACMELIVAGHSVESEILIAPDFDGLILGINWLRSQGRLRWDFDQGSIKFGTQDWIKLREETERPPRANDQRENASVPEYEVRIDEADFHIAPTDRTQRSYRSQLNRKFFRELTMFCRAMNLVEIGREQGRSCNPELDQRILYVKRRVRDDVLATLLRHSPCAADAWARHLIVRNARRTLMTVLCSYLSSSGETSPEGNTDAEEDPVESERPPKLSTSDGKTPEMSSVTRLTSPR